MATYKTRAELEALWILDFEPQEVNYDDVWESFEKTTRSATLIAGAETSMVIRYQSDTPPALSKDAAGEYLLVLGSKTGSVSFVWYGTSATETGAGSLKLKVRDTDGAYRHLVCQVYSDTTGDEYTAILSVTKKATQPVAGDTLTEIKNIGNVSGVWRIHATIV